MERLRSINPQLLFQVGSDDIRRTSLKTMKKDFRAMIERIPWEVVLEGMGAQEGWECFKEVILKV